MQPFVVACLISICGALAATNPAVASETEPRRKAEYPQSWRSVDSLMTNGLTQSALDTVERIYSSAQAAANPAQLVKAIMMRMRLKAGKEENSLVKSMDRLRLEIKDAAFPVTPLLHSMLAECYLQYYQNNRWRFLNRTRTVQGNAGDIETWDLAAVMDSMVAEFTLSLQDAARLKKVELDLLNEIIADRETGVKLRPTLYDLLAHRAVDFFSMDDIEITKPAFVFTLDDARYFDSFEKFTDCRFTSADSTSMKLRAVRILQDLIKFHANDIEALIDADLKRLSFVRRYSVLPNKDSLYLAALQTLEKIAPYSPSSAEVTYAIASLYRQRAQAYVPRSDERYRWMNKEALAACERAVSAFPESFGGRQCAVLAGQIKARHLSFENEYVTVPDKPSKALVSFANLGRTYWRMIPVGIEEYQHLVETETGDSVAVKLARMKPLREWSVDLPEPGDRQRHSVEIELPALSAGHYVIFCASHPRFNHEREAVAFGAVQVSRISSIERRLANGDLEFFVLDRETGTALKGVKAKLWTRVYSNVSGSYKKALQETYTSDKEGRIVAKPDKKNNDYNFIEFENNKDRLVSGEPFYLFRTGRPPKYKTLRTFFFTDRAIYRPGQTVHFKGIVLRTDGENFEPADKENTLVKFMDVNYQEAGRLALTTNDFGSVFGTFTAPRTGLTGQMQITDGHGTACFSVEEYKRPRFLVLTDSVKGCFRLGDTIVFSGRARAYAGPAVGNAQAAYRIVRSRRTPDRWWWPAYPSAQTEIANGRIFTDDTGAFTIRFPALADPAVPEREDPVFTFSLSIDITDMTGETRSVAASIDVGRAALNLSVDVPQLVDKDKSGSTVFPLRTVNGAGTFEPASGTIAVYRLKAPEKTLRQRLWEPPDTAIMTIKAHGAAFPLDQYENELEIATWPKTEAVFETRFDTRQGKEIGIPSLKTWRSGAYLLEAFAGDRFGRRVKDIRYFTLFSADDKKPPFAAADWFVQITDKCEPGDKAVAVVGSGYEKTSVLYEVEHKGEIVHKQWIPLSGSQQRVEFPVAEKFRGNFSMHFTFVRNNRSYRHCALVTVPWTNKELDISFETFRSKLLPGEREQWRMKITGKNKDKVAAEMVASLYDASLDALRPQNWRFDLWPSFYSSREWEISRGFLAAASTTDNKDESPYAYSPGRLYPHLSWFGYAFLGTRHGGGYGARLLRDGGGAAEDEAMERAPMAKNEIASRSNAPAPAAPPVTSMSLDKAGLRPLRGEGFGGGGAAVRQKSGGEEKPAPEDLSTVSVRKNLSETAFFFPVLTAGENGEVIVNFTMPEALTKWKMLGFAHTKDLRSGRIDNELVTQKDLMVTPNPPRFFRENDRIWFSAKVSNLSDKDLTGTAQLLLYDAATMRSVDTLLKNVNNRTDFTVGRGASAPVSWELSIPEGIGAVQFRVAAKAGDFSDGEEQIVPVLANRTLVTEGFPLSIWKKGTKKFTFDKLIGQNGGSKTLSNHRLTLEFVSNPVWYAVQALPYVMEYPYECAEQTFGRFYVNAIASHLTTSSPGIKAVFDQWRSVSPDALLSNLEKNRELKSLLIEETPWLLDGKNESDQKRRIALLFDLNKMADERGRALARLKKQQSASGAWPWFEGMPDDRFITQYIAAGIGRLMRLGLIVPKKDAEVLAMARRAVVYCDDRVREEYEGLLRCCLPDTAGYHIDETQVQYLYMRSFFKNMEMEDRNKKAFAYFSGQAKKSWPRMRRYVQGMTALALARSGDKTVAENIIRSLKENALVSEEMGMYWKDGYEQPSWWWYEAPIEAQALMIEAFSEIADDTASVEDLKVWLLKSKQTQNWPTTKATVEAVYGLLLRGKPLLEKPSNVRITLGGATIDPAGSKELSPEAGSGYVKTFWTPPDIKPEMGNISVTKQEPGAAWGAVYWQYFEQLDKIKPHETPLRILKRLFVARNGPTGPKIAPVEGKTLKTGDKITVRIELRVDRDMEYVHMKDMRASGLEPVNVLSGYRWQDGLGYYESTRDAATGFFFSYLKKGTYVFEYPLVASHAGEFSNGITTIQCMYAPEFTSHSEGIRVKIER